MNEKIVFVRTDKGEDEVRSRTAHLSKDIKRALLMVDGSASVAEILKRSSPSLRGMLEDMFAELAKGGFIQDKTKVGHAAKLVMPHEPVSKKSADEVDELDFTAAYRAPTQAMLAEEAAKQEKKARALAQIAQANEEAARVKAALADAEARLRAEANSAKAAQEAAELKAQAAERARLEAEAAKAHALRQTRELAERHVREAAAAKKQAAEDKVRADAEEKVRLESAKAQARAEVQARLMADTVKAQVDREARELAEVQARELAEEKQRATEEKLRLLEEEKSRIEAAQAQADRAAAQVLADARARAEEQDRRAAEAARVQAELQARELAARLLAEKDAEEAHARELAERQAREAAELKAQAAEALLRAAEEKARQEAERLQSELQARELAARLLAEKDAADAVARELANRHAREAAEAARIAEAHEMRLKAEAEAELRARAVADDKARMEAEVAQLKSRVEASTLAEEQTRLAAERERAELAAAQILEAAVAEEARQAREAQESARRARQEAAQAKAEAAAAARARAAAEEKTQMQIELAKLQAQVEAEAQAHIDALAREKEEVARIKAEQEAIRLAETKPLIAARSETEPNREVGQANTEIFAAVVRLNEKHAAAEQSVFAALESLAQQEAAEEEAAATDVMAQGELSAQLLNLSGKRTTIAAVLFFDIVDYTTHSNKMQIELKSQLSRLVANGMDSQGAGDRVVLNMGEGVAIGFLQQPTDALEAAMHCRNNLMANKYNEYPDLVVHMGIHLGSVSLVKDLNGQIGMTGDGVTSAQRVMSTAGDNQICVSRAYFDFVSSLSDEYHNLFRYRCAQQDKLGRELHVYELLDSDAPVEELAPVTLPEEILPPVESDLFNFDAFEKTLAQSTSQLIPQQEARPSVASQLLNDAAGLRLLEDIKLSVEPPKRAAEPSRVAEASAPLYSEDESRHAAALQVKKWAEAEARAATEQRALVFAGNTAESVAPQKAVIPAPIKHRKPVSWGKLTAGLAASVVIALLVVPALMPTEGYATRIEQMLSKKLQQPVHIGHLAGRILPTPRLVLSDVYIGETKQIQAPQVQVNFAFSALLGSVKRIDSLDLDRVKVQGTALPSVVTWLQQTAADPQYPVARVTLLQGQLDAKGVDLSHVDGALDFDTAGKFTQANLNANEHKLALEIRASSKVTVTLTLRDSVLPSLPNWTFDELKAVGELSQDQLHITELDGRIRGGVLSGNARINWRTNWRAEGALVAKAISMQSINTLLAGDLDGTAQFQMQAGSLATLTDTAVLNGAFNVKKGIINGVDIVETARLRSRENLPGGRTHFDDLSGELSYANGRYRFSQIRINDQIVKVAGAFSVDQQALTGSISADLASRGGAVALQIGGTTASPALHVAH